RRRRHGRRPRARSGSGRARRVALTIPRAVARSNDRARRHVDPAGFSRPAVALAAGGLRALSCRSYRHYEDPVLPWCMNPTEEPNAGAESLTGDEVWLLSLAVSYGVPLAHLLYEKVHEVLNIHPRPATQTEVAAALRSLAARGFVRIETQLPDGSKCV